MRVSVYLPKGLFLESGSEHGQTLVETVVGVSMLVMAITAALGLVNYSLSLTTNVTKQMVAMGLAREGQEAVRNMRDTNWLRGTPSLACGVAHDQVCYTGWLDESGNGGYNLDSTDYALGFNDQASPGDPYWTLSQADDDSPWLKLCTHDTVLSGFYFPADISGSCDAPARDSGYRRLVRISGDTGGGDYDATIGQRITVTVQVWWQDRGCSDSASFPGVGRCGVELKSYLTNWKNY